MIRDRKRGRAWWRLDDLDQIGMMSHGWSHSTGALTAFYAQPSFCVPSLTQLGEVLDESLVMMLIVLACFGMSAAAGRQVPRS